MMENRQVKRLTSSFFLLIIVVVIVFVVSNRALRGSAFNGGEIIRALHVDLLFSRFPANSKLGELRSNGSKPLVSTSRTSFTDSVERETLPEHKGFVPKNSSATFHERVTAFFRDDCEVRFFMTWISSVLSFGPREMSTVESVFKVHPRGCLLLLSSAMDSPEGYVLLRQYLDRGFRIGAITPDLAFLLKDIPTAKSWLEDIESGKISPGRFPLGQNLSNLMRLAVLYKYGGVYCDTDFIVLKSFMGLRNVIGEQVNGKEAKRWPRLNNAVLIFDQNHFLLLKLITQFAKSFNGNIWGHNGPGLLTRVVDKLDGSAGKNFFVLPPKAFYPVHWIEISTLYKGPKFENETRWIDAKIQKLRQESYGVHLWNKVSRKYTIEEGSVIQKLVTD